MDHPTPATLEIAYAANVAKINFESYLYTHQFINPNLRIFLTLYDDLQIHHTDADLIDVIANPIEVKYVINNPVEHLHT